MMLYFFRKKLISIVLLVLLVFSTAVYADNFHISSITQKTGLPNNLINDLSKDSEGYLWVASLGGIARFDGESWLSYQYDAKNISALSSNNATKIYTDSDGYIWIGTRNSGINRFNQKTQTFQNYFNTMTITGIVEDNDRSMWVGTQNNGLYRIDKSGELINHFFDRDRINYVGRIADKIFVSNERLGLHRLDGNEFLFLSDLGVYHVLSAGESLEELWLATKAGLYLFNIKKFTSKRYLNEFWVVDMAYRKPGELWVATENSGLILFDDRDKSLLHHLRSVNPDAKILNDNNIRSLLVDENGITWVGSAGGLNKILTKPFQTYRSTYIGSNNVLNTYIRDFAEDNDGSIWTGSWGAGIAKFNLTTRRSTNYPSEINQSLRVAKLLYDKDAHQLWVASDSGLYLFDIASLKWEKIIFSEDDLNILSMSETRLGYLLLSTENNGLFVFDPKVRQVLNHYTHRPDDKNSLLHSTIHHALEISTGEILLATAAGLNILQPSSGQIYSYKYQGGDESGPSHGDVLLVMEDRSNKIWLNAGGELNLMGRDSNGNVVFKHLNKQLNIDQNIVSPILEDSLGYLWFSTQKIIYRYNLDNNDLLSFNQEDVLPYQSGTERASIVLRSDEIIVGNTNGFIVIDPYRVVPSQHNPPVKITSVTVNNDRKINISNLQLNSESDSVVFGFASLDYKDPAKNQYAYRLDGLQKTWVYGGGENFATYTDLPEGRYTFMVKGTNSDGQWSDHIASLVVVVGSSWWQSGWAYFCYAVVLLLFAVAYMVSVNRFNVSRVQNKRNAADDDREARAKLERLSGSSQADDDKDGYNKQDLNQAGGAVSGPSILQASEKLISHKDEKFLSQLYDCVSTNYQDNKFGIKHICKELCLTEGPMQKRLKATLGMTLNKYIQIYRLERAADHLRNNTVETGKQLYEVVGFSSQAYFITCFKSYFGVTPKHYAIQHHSES